LYQAKLQNSKNQNVQILKHKITALAEIDLKLAVDRFKMF